jgi:hypothetical protein
MHLTFFIQVWGTASGRSEAGFWFSFKSFAKPEHETPFDGHVSYQYQMNQQPFTYQARCPFGITWPDAVQHPMFYVGIYAAIGLGALVNVSSVAAQYTGALRASRILFRFVLLTPAE